MRGPEHVAGPYMWQMPQGGVDPGEDPESAARRELYEETNVPPDALRLLAEIPDWLPYDLPADVIKQAWQGRYRGQTQRWFAYGLPGRRGVDRRAASGGRRPQGRIRRVALGPVRGTAGPDRAVQAPDLRARGGGLLGSRALGGRFVTLRPGV